MRAIQWCSMTLVAIAVAGCGSDRSASGEQAVTPASYDAISADRTRGRDTDTMTEPGGGEVQAAYDRDRSEQRATGRIGTDGEKARAGGATSGAVGGTSAGSESGGALGGTSAGSEAGGDVGGGTVGSPGQPSSGLPAGGDRPIPYSGSRAVEAPYPGIPADTAPRSTKPAPIPARPPETNPKDSDPGTMGLPYSPEMRDASQPHARDANPGTMGIPYSPEQRKATPPAPTPSQPPTSTTTDYGFSNY